MLLKVKAQYENVKLVILNVYAPTIGVDRMAFLNILCDTVGACDSDDFMFLGGGFNCNKNPTIDRNHTEPHAASSRRIRPLRETHKLSDVWRALTVITGSSPGATQGTILYSG